MEHIQILEMNLLLRAKFMDLFWPKAIQLT